MIDLLDGFIRVFGEDPVDAFFEVEHDSDSAFDVGGCAAGAAGHLMDHDMGVGQAVAFTWGTGGEQDGTHGGGDADAVGIHIAGEELHRVINSEASGDGATGGIDIDVNVLFGVLHLQEQELGDDGVGDEIIDAGADEDDAILEQARVNIKRTLTTAILFDDDGDVITIAWGRFAHGR